MESYRRGLGVVFLVLVEGRVKFPSSYYGWCCKPAVIIRVYMDQHHVKGESLKQTPPLIRNKQKFPKPVPDLAEVVHALRLHQVFVT